MDGLALIKHGGRINYRPPWPCNHFSRFQEYRHPVLPGYILPVVLGLQSCFNCRFDFLLSCLVIGSQNMIFIVRHNAFPGLASPYFLATNDQRDFDLGSFHFCQLFFQDLLLDTAWPVVQCRFILRSFQVKKPVRHNNTSYYYLGCIPPRDRIWHRLTVYSYLKAANEKSAAQQICTAELVVICTSLLSKREAQPFPATPYRS